MVAYLWWTPGLAPSSMSTEIENKLRTQAINHINITYNIQHHNKHKQQEVWNFDRHIFIYVLSFSFILWPISRTPEYLNTLTNSAAILHSEWQFEQMEISSRQVIWDAARHAAGVWYWDIWHRGSDIHEAVMTYPFAWHFAFLNFAFLNFAFLNFAFW